MRNPLFALLLLSSVITVKAQPVNKPTKPVSVQSKDQQTTPEPEGGLDALLKYMKKYCNHQYNNAQTGKVTIGFFVEKDGTLSEFKIINSLNKEADTIAIQILKDYNHKWKPAMENGQSVRAQYSIEVPFG